MPKSVVLNAKKWCFKCQKWRLTFMKWTPGGMKENPTNTFAFNLEDGIKLVKIKGCDC